MDVSSARADARSNDMRVRAFAVLFLMLGCRLSVPAPAHQPPPVFDPPAGPGAMAGNLSAGRRGLLATWVEPALDAGVQRVRLARWEGAWSSPSTIAEGADILANWADVPSAVEADDGTLVAHWAQSLTGAPHASNVQIAHSVDRGSTWKRLGLAHDDGTATEHGFVSLIADGPSPRAFWLDGRLTAGGHHGRGSMTLRTARIAGAITEGEPLDLRVCDCCGTAATTTSRGPLVAFRDRSADEVRDISVIRRERGAWSAPKIVHADGWKIPGCPVNGPALAAENDRVAMAWFTAAAGRPTVKVAFSDDAGASFAPPIDVDVPRGRAAPIGRVGLVLDGEAALVSWMTSERERAQVLVRRVNRDGRRGRPLVIADSSSERASGFPRLAKWDDSIFLLRTESGAASRLRFARMPLASIPPADDSAVPTPEVADASLVPNTPLPDYRARTLQGQEVSMASLRGRALLLNFWATWCEPCRTELPELAKLHRRYAPRGLHVIGISLDTQQTPEQVKAFADRREVPYPILLDAQDRASAQLGVGVLPATVVVGRDGMVVLSRTGAVLEDDPELNSAIEAALR